MITAKISDAILDILAEVPAGKGLNLATLADQVNAALPEIAVDYHMTREHCNWLLNKGYLASQAHPLSADQQMLSITIAGKCIAEQFDGDLPATEKN
jgi:hypothetical protein